jgi:hypothetical protein
MIDGTKTRATSLRRIPELQPRRPLQTGRDHSVSGTPAQSRVTLFTFEIGIIGTVNQIVFVRITGKLDSRAGICCLGGVSPNQADIWKSRTESGTFLSAGRQKTASIIIFAWNVNRGCDVTSLLQNTYG